MRPATQHSLPKLAVALAMAAVLLQPACRTTAGASEVKWGNLKDLDQRIDASAYLFGVKASETVHACISGSLPRGLSEDWLKAEIFTAVNLWAASIGRTLPLVFDGCKAKPALRIAFATPPVAGDIIGYSWFKDGERQVFLSPAYDWEGTSETLGFQRLPELQADQWQKKAVFLVPIFMDQHYTPIVLSRPGLTGKPRQPTFGTLLHEIGHAFGQCDLYSDKSTTPDFNGNCSSSNRSKTINPQEIMTAGTRPGTARFNLTAEDKAGLHHLAERSDFPKQGWPASTNALASADVVARLDATGAAPDAAGEPRLKLTGPASIDYLPGRRSARVRLVVTGPQSATNGLLREKTGRGPARPLEEADSALVGGQRQWQVDLELDASSSKYQYIATLSDDPRAEAKAEFLVP